MKIDIAEMVREVLEEEEETLLELIKWRVKATIDFERIIDELEILGEEELTNIAEQKITEMFEFDIDR